MNAITLLLTVAIGITYVLGIVGANDRITVHYKGSSATFLKAAMAALWPVFSIMANIIQGFLIITDRK